MPFGDTTSEEIERVAREIVDAAFKVHSALGPDGRIFETEYRLDLLVEDLVIVELKSVSEIIPIYKAQVLTYLKLMEKRLGLLINFNVEYIKDGIKRIVL